MHNTDIVPDALRHNSVELLCIRKYDNAPETMLIKQIIAWPHS